MQANCYSGHYYLTSFTAPTPVTSDFLYRNFPLVPSDDSLVPLMRLRVLVSSKILSNISGSSILIETTTSNSFFQDDSLVWLDISPTTSINIQPYLHQTLHRLHVQVVIPGYCHPYDGQLKIENQLNNEYEEYQTALKVSDQGAEELTSLTNVTLPLPLIILALKKKKLLASQNNQNLNNLPLINDDVIPSSLYLLHNNESINTYRYIKNLYEDEKQEEYNQKLNKEANSDILGQIASNEVVKQGLKTVKKGATSFWKAVKSTTEMLQHVNLTETISSTINNIASVTTNTSTSTNYNYETDLISPLLFNSEKTLTIIHRLSTIQYDPNRNDINFLTPYGLKFQTFTNSSVNVAKYEGNLLSQLYYSLFNIQPKDLFNESNQINKTNSLLTSLNDFDMYNYMSDKWKLVGFQSNYPPNDLKTSGLLALSSLYYMSTIYSTKTRVMYSNNSLAYLQKKLNNSAPLPNASTLYPFSLIGINLTLMLIDVLKINNKEYLNELNPANGDNSHLKYLVFQDYSIYNELFCSLFFYLDYEWVSKQYVRSKFNELITTVKNFLIVNLNNVSESLLRNPNQDCLQCWFNSLKRTCPFGEVYSQTNQI